MTYISGLAILPYILNTVAWICFILGTIVQSVRLRLTTCYQLSMTYISQSTMTSDFLCIKYIDDIYFFEVNTKYISSNVLKISAFSRVRSTSKNDDIFNT